jgi:SagB-type dehydrogenase family enzyme
MRNSELAATWRYHDGTKHSQESLRRSRHVLDWSNRPLPYKIYESLPAIPLPTDFAPSAIPALDAIAASGEEPAGERVPDLATLARLCYFANGVTKRLRRGDQEIAFRAAACTGALFHVEVYLVCGELPDLAAGVYHFGAHDNGLRRLRAGDFRQALVEATGGEPAVAAAPVVAICTSTFWRNAWKYQARAYRHSFWDAGTILANLLAVAAAAELPARVVLGFADAEVNRLLDVDPEREEAIALVALGRTQQEPNAAASMPPLGFPTAPLSRYEVTYPEIQRMHAASSLDSGSEAAAWRGAMPLRTPLPPAEPPIALRPIDTGHLPDEPIETVIRRRGSTRRFRQAPIGAGQLTTILDRATRGFSADFLAPEADSLGDAYLIVNAVEGLRAGTYVLHREPLALEALTEGDYREVAGHLALDQDLGADAAANLYVLTALEPVLERFGNRGYRAAQLAAAITAGKLYLAAYALGIGATGLTFFDDEVTDFFSPHAADKGVMFLLAAGVPDRRRG